MTPAAPSSASPDIGFAESSLGQSLLRVLAEGSTSNRAIADYVLRNQVRVTALGIEELADACDVSTATISRFARDLGFRNYAAMRGAVAETLQSVLQPVEKLRSTIARRAAKASPALESLGYAEAAITATSRALAGTQIDRIGAVLTRARTVYVLGFGLSSFLAGALAMHLQPFCRHVVEAAASGGTEVAASHLATITGKDVLVVISLPRYTLDAASLTRFARDAGATIVSITDSPASPLAELGHHVLYAHSTHPVLPSSSSAALAVIEALAVSLMTSNKANVAKAARHTEAIAAYLHGEHQIRKLVKKT
ncbi:RpiR family transcriptional regulator [Massilia sp. Root133]|uniref:MurR/RpiR family transcriptional regulator n=1 Tax=unclassified Massilia TaxID=2609279 RepID=UPI00070185D4|nr:MULTISPECIES: MurR/RpiR family transcriptional regulator [unclassified Massilia]KQY12367.1 RpiR family transcriptional regulator [Massilia sp. Root133]KQZ41078.1 RpiR family transcriptional regulator [Massilia sp. Root1485]HWU52349.1 MurR/RpiR family transcriptional regulator [Tahibacter sp.]